ncbi:conserved hypothetical protein [Shewanella halifaxensis HAW-EB4]|uniref:Uncharacterized protein n=1 Tax=Shewanella halifaxensis (strain HAW-EB4) TaxID=458817 RepID=B0TPZ7_SHEHH|nr:hypothetical protein [Shewanella halifaxensis]ABZ76276.1 conserved hypothetical protein [Shewanella halifaxensis HAW-EB4]
MVTFKYALNQDNIELQASNWSGLEQMYINGKRVSSKLNFGQQSEHNLVLNDGKPAKLLLFLDPMTEQLICRIYKQNNLVASLKQGKKELYRSRQLTQQGILAVGIVIVFLLTLS